MPSIFVRYSALDDVDEIAHVHVTTWQSAYRGIVPQDFLDSLSVAKRSEHWKAIISYNQLHDNHALFVVIDNGKLCGFVGCGPSRDKDFPGYAEIYAAYVLPECQKHGYGDKLFKRSKAFLQEKGFKQAYVWSLERNAAAHRAYQKWGARKTPEHSKITEIGSAKLQEIAHLWKW